MRVTVQPASDGYNMRGNWVTKRGGKSKPSTKKSAAIRKAREMANEGDTLVVKGTDGRVLSGYPRTYRGSYATDTADNSTQNGFRGRDAGSDEPATVESRDPADDTLDDSMGVEFRDPVEGTDILRDDFLENKTDTEDALDDLF